eukprot:TRINITY_DN1876_c0_g1_i1.p1 TRINITY_DN1876_c0_g1~~TRINITY_DN1876_c0_g1_i1.p1  ORF type:complete len:631 (-),score=163.24 TRINITY_DN1876_c0_g1_i1:1020-2912(-)
MCIRDREKLQQHFQSRITQGKNRMQEYLDTLRVTLSLEGDSRKYRYEVSLPSTASWSIAELKKELFRRSGVPEAAIVLQYNGFEAGDDWMVEELGGLGTGDEEEFQMTVKPSTRLPPGVPFSTSVQEQNLLAEDEAPQGTLQDLAAQVERAVDCEEKTGEGHNLQAGWAYVSSKSYTALLDHFERERDQIQVDGCKGFMKHKLREVRKVTGSMGKLEEKYRNTLHDVAEDNARVLYFAAEEEVVKRFNPHEEEDEEAKRLLRINAKKAADEIEFMEQNKLEEEQLRRRFWMDVGLYTAVLVFYSAVTFATRGFDGESFYTQQGVADLITSEHNALRLQDVNTEDKVWLWSEGFVDSVYQGGSTIGRSNTMLGALRMRQLRCQPSTCSVQTEIDPNATVCYPQLSGSGDQDQFGTNQTYSFSSESGFGWTSGMTGLEYPASGFVTPLSQDSKTEALTTLASMKASQWIDLQTRFVAFEVNTYNPNVDLVTTVLVAFELDASGGVYGSYVTSPFRLFRYYTATDWVILAMEILIVAYIGVFVVLESKKIRNALELGHIKLYLTDGWSLLEWFNAIGFFLSVILRIVFLAKAASFSLDPAKPEFQNMRAISDLFEVESLVAAVNSFILYIQVS